MTKTRSTFDMNRDGESCSGLRKISSDLKRKKKAKEGNSLKRENDDRIESEKRKKRKRKRREEEKKKSATEKEEERNSEEKAPVPLSSRLLRSPSLTSSRVVEDNTDRSGSPNLASKIKLKLQEKLLQRATEKLERSKKKEEKLKRELEQKNRELLRAKKEASEAEKKSKDNENSGAEMFKDMMRNFKELLDSHFHCPVCDELMVSPTVLSKCGHTFCRECVDAWTVDQRKNSCPVCRTEITEVAEVMVVNQYLDKTVETFFAESEKKQRRELEDERKLKAEQRRKREEENDGNSIQSPARNGFDSDQSDDDGSYHESDDSWEWGGLANNDRSDQMYESDNSDAASEEDYEQARSDEDNFGHDTEEEEDGNGMWERNEDGYEQQEQEEEQPRFPVGYYSGEGEATVSEDQEYLDDRWTDAEGGDGADDDGEGEAEFSEQDVENDDDDQGDVWSDAPDENPGDWSDNDSATQSDRVEYIDEVLTTPNYSDYTDDEDY